MLVYVYFNLGLAKSGQEWCRSWLDQVHKFNA